tara:strand:+ start:4298 stop:5668 length:1371 start_codon:yes stop_codon:yes gene_type:complete
MTTNLKQNEFTVVTMTTDSYHRKILKDGINLMPIGQRNNVQASLIGGVEPSKAQSIIAAMLRGEDIGEISLAHSDESLDGGHRSRSIVGFIEGDFPLHKSSPYGELYFPQLNDDVKEFFLNYNLRITDFYELEGREIGKQFIQFNTTTPPVFAEKMNSYGYEGSIVNLREKVKVCDYSLEPKVEGYEGIVDNVIPYFKEYAGYKDTRMKYLEQMLESVTLHHTGNIAIKEKDIVEYLDTASEKEIIAAEKAVDAEYEFYKNIAIYWKIYKGYKPTIMDFGILRNLYFTLPKGFKIENYENFVKEFLNNLNYFYTSNEKEPFVDENGDLVDGRYNMVTSAFKSYVKKVDSEAKTVQAREWLEPLIPAVITKDSLRSFSKDDLLKRWTEVGETCEVTGDSIPFQSVVGAHIIPHSQGGKTVYGNLMVTTKFHNQRMGTMNAMEYKRAFLAENPIAEKG